MNCFCGCGQNVPRLPIGIHSVNKRGAIIASDVRRIEALLGQGMNSPSARGFVAAGHEWMATLAGCVHTGTDPGDAVEGATRAFMAEGRERFGVAALGAAIGDSGMDTEEAGAALTSGAFDPFGD